VSIESYDVEPVDVRRPFSWVLGAVATVTGTLAVIGWPLPVVSRRSGTWEQTTSLVRDWWQHDGWRMTGDSWLWAAVAIAATTAAIACRYRRAPWTSRTWLLVLVPGCSLAVSGPVVQVLAGIPWRNYAAGHDSRSGVVVFAVVLAGAVGLPFLLHRIERARPGRTTHPDH